jgi:hypothetical protein
LEERPRRIGIGKWGSGAYLSLNHGARVFDDPGYSHARRALCVHASKGQQPTTFGATSANAVSSSGKHETQLSGYWIDPSTGLMWAGKDNFQNYGVSEAMKYCRDLQLARYSDWRLPTIDELQGIYDQQAESPGESPRSRWNEPESLPFHVKGNLFLTGKQWSSTRENDDSSPPFVNAWRLDFIDGSRFHDKRGFPTWARALCVRPSSK